MGLVGIIIAVIIVIIIFFFSYLSNSPSTLTPEKSEKIQTEAQEVMDSTVKRNTLEQNQIKNIDQP